MKNDWLNIILRYSSIGMLGSAIIVAGAPFAKTETLRKAAARADFLFRGTDSLAAFSFFLRDRLSWKPEKSVNRPLVKVRRGAAPRGEAPHRMESGSAKSEVDSPVTGVATTEAHDRAVPGDHGTRQAQSSRETARHVVRRKVATAPQKQDDATKDTSTSPAALAPQSPAQPRENPYTDEYSAAKAAYQEYWQRARELTAKRDATSGAERIRYSNQLREMRAENTRLSNALQDAAQKFNGWQKEQSESSDEQ